MRGLRLLLLGLASLLVTASAWTAGNGSVQIIRYDENVVGSIFADCGDFQILEDAHYDWAIRVHDDPGGLWLANQIRTSEGRLYNSNDPSIFLLTGPGEVQNNTHIDPATGVFTASGPMFKVVVPGVGPLFFETGLFVANFYTATLYRSTAFNDYAMGDFAALCTALTP